MKDTVLLVLGIAIFVLGVILPTIPVEVTRYRNVFGFQVPYKATEYPFQGVGVLLIGISITIIIYSFYSKKEAST